MKLFYGRSRSDYQDVLRTVGALIDERGYTDIRILETEEGLVLQGRLETRNKVGEAGYDTYLITDDDLKVMIQDAFQRRGQEPPDYART